MKRLVIIGASGHGKVVADIARKSGYCEIAFLDDNEAVKTCDGYPVIGRSAEAASQGCDVIVAIGNATIRQRLQETLERAGTRIATLVHPNAVVAESATLGTGTVVMAGAVINPGAKIGRGCIVNTCASVDHDCIIGDFVHVSVGAHVAGSVSIGQRTWIGAGSTVSNNVTICPDCMIGAGTVVVRDITESGTYVGVPARRVS